MRSGPSRQFTIMRLQPTVYGLAGLLGAALFVLSLVVVHLARADIAWTRHYVSDLANGPLGWVFVSGALAHGIGNLALSLGLRRSLDSGRFRAWAVFLFALAAAGILVAALFPIDPPGRAPTSIGLVHRLAVGASFPLELVALFLFSAVFARHPGWRRRSAASFVLSAIAAVALAAFVLAVMLKTLPGLAERTALASFLAWEFWVALRLAQPPALS